MADDLQCLQNIIGISKSDCECISSEFDEDAKISNSGLYLDKLDGIVSFRAVSDSQECSDQVAQFYIDAIETAKIELRDDLIIGLLGRFQQANKAYQGKAGGTKYTLSESLSGDYAGVHFKNEWIRGGNLRIREIKAMFATPPEILSIYRMEKQTNVIEHVRDITHEAIIPNTVFTIVVTEEEGSLDLDGYEYFVLYDAAGVVPKNNSTSCGCGASERDMKKFVHLSGVQGSDLENFPAWSKGSSAHGLAFEIEIGCDAGNILCEVVAGDERFKKVVAYMIRFKAGEHVNSKVLHTPEVSRWTMVDTETVRNMRNHFRKEYLDRLDYVIENIDINQFSDCYVCTNNHKRLAKSGLLI